MPRRKKDPDPPALPDAPQKRGYGKGSIREKRNRSGELVYEWQWYHQGKRHTGTAETYEDAEKTLDRTLHRILHPAPIEPEALTVRVHFRRWLSEIIEPYRAPNTYAYYEASYRLHVDPFLGSVPLADLSRKRIQEWVNELGRQGRHPATVKNAYKTLAGGFKQAVIWDLLPDTPCRFIQIPKQTRTEFGVWDPEEVERFLAATTDNPYRLAFLLSLQLGIRQNEIFCLTWSDVDLENRRLRIRGTKTAGSNRTLVLPLSLLPEIRRHRARQLEQVLACGGRDRWLGEDRVVTTSTGAKPCRRGFGQRFHSAVRRAGVPQLRFHDLRHTCATLRLRAGEPLMVVSKMLGHANSQITLKVYTHVVKNDLEAWADHFDTLLGAKNAPIADGLQNEEEAG